MSGSPIIWTGQDAAKATGGVLVGNWAARGVSIDTRSLQENDLFVPLKDARDGHDFIPNAYEAGAAATLSEHAIHDAPALVVDDIQNALENLAAFARDRSAAKRIAITGSVGKTSVKEMLAVIGAAAGKTHASQKSFNNHWGVPLTLASMPSDTQFGIFETGMNHEGELRTLSNIIKPDIAVVTTVAPAHLAHFINVEAIAFAKSEIFEGLVDGGVAIINADNAYARLLRERAVASGGDVRTFGRDEDADACILKSDERAERSRVKLRIHSKIYDVNIPLAGAHWVENTACALLAAACAGIDLKLAIVAVESMRAIEGRGAVHALKIGDMAVTLIDESYNANPASMASAISALALRSGRRVAVLGDMLELGKEEGVLHAELSNIIIEKQIDRVITCGNKMKALHDVLPLKQNAGWYPDSLMCEQGLRAELRSDDSVMIKGSNASGMGKVVASLLANPSSSEICKNEKDHVHAL